jgi:WD40 repeat protein
LYPLTVALAGESTVHPAVRSVSISPEGELLASCVRLKNDGAMVELWQVKTHRSIWKRHFKLDLAAIAFSPSGKRLAVASFEGKVDIVDVANGKTELVLRGKKGSEVEIAFSPAGNFLAVADGEAAIGIWNLTTGFRERALSCEQKQYTVQFSQSGKLLATGGQNGATIWDVANNRAVKRLARGISVLELEFLDGDSAVLAHIPDGSIAVWNLDAEREDYSIAPESLVSRMKYLAGKGQLACANHLQQVLLFDVGPHRLTEVERNRSATLLTQLDDPSYHVRENAEEKLFRCGLSAYGILAEARENSSSVEVRVRCRRLLNRLLSTSPVELPGGPERMNSLGFSKSAGLLVGGGDDGLVRVWDVSAGKQLAVFTPQGK